MKFKIMSWEAYFNKKSHPSQLRLIIYLLHILHKKGRIQQNI